MAVIYWQSFIIISILITYYLFKEKTALYVCIFWTVWTLVLLFYPPLAIIQLVTIWGTLLLINVFKKKNDKISKYEETLKYYEPQRREIIDNINLSQIRIISGKEHIEELYNSIDQASRSVYILSGWISKYVINDTLINKITNAISRDVTIHLGFGWEDSRSRHTATMSTHEAFQKLLKIQQQANGKLIIAKFPNHEKTLIKDNEYIIWGSNNWLSNNHFRNSERSIIIYSSEIATQEAERINEIMIENKVL